MALLPARAAELFGWSEERLVELQRQQRSRVNFELDPTDGPVKADPHPRRLCAGSPILEACSGPDRTDWRLAGAPRQPQDPPQDRRRAASHASDYRGARPGRVGVSPGGRVTELSGGRSGNALSRTCAQSRTRIGSSSAPLAAADSRDLFHAVIELRRARPGRRHGAGVGHRRGQRCGDAGVHQADDARIGEAASARAALPATLALDDAQERRCWPLLLDETGSLRWAARPAAHCSLGRAPAVLRAVRGPWWAPRQVVVADRAAAGAGVTEGEDHARAPRHRPARRAREHGQQPARRPPRPAGARAPQAGGGPRPGREPIRSGCRAAWSGGRRPACRAGRRAFRRSRPRRRRARRACRPARHA
jgi:hypothetical protein